MFSARRKRPKPSGGLPFTFSYFLYKHTKTKIISTKNKINNENGVSN